jgi:NDP-sugar pyrophosphorylase family protein
MLPVLGKPMVVRMMEQLYDGGIKRFVVVVGRDEGGVAAYLDKSWLPDVQVDFVLKASNIDLGRVLAKITRQYQPPFILASYNSFAHSHFTQRIARVFDESSPEGLLMATAESSLSAHEQPYIGYLKDGYVNSVTARLPDHDAGIGWLLDYAICGPAFEPFLETLIASGQRTHHLMDLLGHFVRMQEPIRSVEAAWILPVRCDIDLLTLNQHLLERDQHSHILSEIPTSVQIIPPVRIDPQVSVGPDATLGPYVYLEAGSQVGARAHLQKALVLQNGVVYANENLSNLLIASRTRIQA